MRPRIWTIDLRHYIGDDGECADMPEAVFSLASYMFAIVEWVTIVGAVTEATLTNVACRRRPGRRRCRGPILAKVGDPSTSVAWWCGSCGESGFIHHWQDTLWDRRGEVENLRALDRTTH